MIIDRKKFFDGVRAKLINHFTQKQVDGLNVLLDQFEEDPIWSDIRHIAYALSTICIETAWTFQPITEYGEKSYFNKYDGRKTLGNTAKGDGYKYRGRGFVQLTGKANYKKFAEILKLDLIKKPDLVLEPQNAFLIMTIGMFRGSFTGVAFRHYINGKETNYKEARRIINGTDKQNTIAGYAVKFENVLRNSLIIDKQKQTATALKNSEIVLDIPEPSASPAEAAATANPQRQGLDEKQINPSSAPSSNDSDSQNAENIINFDTGDLKDKAIDIARNLPPLELPETKSLRFHTKILGYLGGLFAGTMAFPPILENLFSVEIALKLINVMIFVLPYLIPSIVFAVVAWYAIRTFKEFKKLKLQVENNTKLDTRDFNFVKPQNTNENRIQRLFG
ncbi:MAG: hypothetical protein ACR2MD_02785 [Aridibacter sp.]